MISLLLPVSAFGLLLQPPALGAPKFSLRAASRQSVLPRMEASVDSQASTATEEKTDPGTVTREKTTYELAFVDSPAQITTGPVTEKVVPAWKLTNDVGMSVTVIQQGACAVKVEKGGKNYLWENKATKEGDPPTGACYYGENTNNFPLKRGLILHGGIRAAAVTAEHGLYYDTEWPITFEESEGSQTIIFEITDNDEQRAKCAHGADDPYPDPPGNDGPFSVGQFAQPEKPDEPMSFYPTTNCVFQARITLRAGEEFVRFKMSVENPTEKAALGEAWFPQTYPITEESKIISPQRMRWKRDGWCFPDIAQLFPWTDETFVKPLDWPTDGIFYDFPTKDGSYHAVSAGDEKGSGCACVTRVAPDEPQFTKLWSWGKKASGGDGLSQGRPATEYYEPWASAFNFAFFQRAEFAAGSTSSFEMAVLPIDEGLSNDKSNKELRETVEAAVANANIDLEPTVPGLKPLPE